MISTDISRKLKQIRNSLQKRRIARRIRTTRNLPERRKTKTRKKIKRNKSLSISLKKGTAHKELFLFCIYSPYVQYRNVLSVRILAKINPNGRAATISIAAANQEADAERFMVPRL